jgi:hypothetical protein
MIARLQMFAARVGLTGLALAILLALLALQTVRIEGFALWPLQWEGLKTENAGLRDEIRALEKKLDRVAEAQAVAAQRAAAFRLAEQQRFQDMKEKTDAELENARVAAMDDARRFIERNRVRPPAAGGAGGGPAAPGGDRDSGGAVQAGGAAELDDWVAVPAGDVLICTDNTLRLEAGQDWAAGLDWVPPD